MNSAPCQRSPHLSITLKSCHPERSLVESEANRQTESKDPLLSGRGTGDERNFRIVVRFFEEDNAVHLPVSIGEAEASERTVRQSRADAAQETSPKRTAPAHLRITK